MDVMEKSTLRLAYNVHVVAASADGEVPVGGGGGAAGITLVLKRI